jgi:hypothetical protein
VGPKAGHNTVVKRTISAFGHPACSLLNIRNIYCRPRHDIFHELVYTCVLNGTSFSLNITVGFVGRYVFV